MTAYGTSPVKRVRRTKAELAALDEAIVSALAVDHPSTVRGVFYKVMSAGAVPKTENGYRAVQQRLLGLRRDRVVPYSYVTDGTRWRRKPETWSDLDDMLEDAAVSYRRALWRDQDTYVEVWSEKDAISGVVYPVTAKWDVPLMVSRGFSSETFLWTSAEEIAEIDKPTVIYNLGDHDPSGVAAWRDIERKMQRMLDEMGFTEHLTFERLAVTEQQVVDLSLPTRPTKSSDSRAKRFSGESVEVDAIPSSVLRTIVEDAIEALVDDDALRVTRVVEASERAVLRSMVGAA